MFALQGAQHLARGSMTSVICEALQASPKQAQVVRDGGAQRNRA